MSTFQNDPALWILRYKNQGYSFFNTGSRAKKIFTKWEQYQNRKPTDEEIATWLQSPTQNYAVVCGEISNLVVFDVDTHKGGDPTPFLNRGLYEVRTPSGGYHFYTRYNPILSSTKHDKSKKGGILTSVDVQTNGAVVFAPPTNFTEGAKLGAYTLVNDVPITDLPEDLLISVLDALQPEKNAEYTPYIPKAIPENGRPGDIFNALMSWDEILIPLGWTKVGGKRANGTQFWRRPGKEERGSISASTNYNNYDLFFPYTTHFSELNHKKGYTKFNLYATLLHGGDYRKAARELVAENYKKAMSV